MEAVVAKRGRSRRGGGRGGRGRSRSSRGRSRSLTKLHTGEELPWVGIVAS